MHVQTKIDKVTAEGAVSRRKEKGKGKEAKNPWKSKIGTVVDQFGVIIFSNKMVCI